MFLWRTGGALLLLDEDVLVVDLLGIAFVEELLDDMTLRRQSSRLRAAAASFDMFTVMIQQF